MQLVFEELRRIVSDLEIPEFKRYKNLRNKVLEVMFSLLNKCLNPTL